MLDVIKDTVIDSLKLLPFLFLTFLLMEYFEHKMKNKSKKIVEKAGKFGPIIGSFLGVIPQCGFSVAATNLYATRIITLGTLISIYLSTSDEMLPILLSEKVEFSLIAEVLLIKIIVGIICGFIIDLVYRKKEKVEIREFCHDKHCDCEHSILKSTLKHTFDIFLFIFIISFVLNLAFSYLGEEVISSILMKNSIFGSFLTSLLGLIPNCFSSVLITQLYLKNTISFASMIGGLLTGSGVALLVLFRVNKDKKQNFRILLLLYLIGALTGLLISVFDMIF